MSEVLSVEQIEREITSIVIGGGNTSNEMERRLRKLIDCNNPNLPIILKSYSWARETGLPYDGLDIICGSQETSFAGYGVSIGALARKLAHVDDEYQPKEVIFRMMKRIQPHIVGGAYVYLESSDRHIEIEAIRAIHPQHVGFYYWKKSNESAFVRFQHITHIVPRGDVEAFNAPAEPGVK